MKEADRRAVQRRWEAMSRRVDDVSPWLRSRGKAGVEGDGQWKVTVPVTWLRHGLALQNLTMGH